MRKWLLNLHLYLLLACSSYLILLGVSVLLFNHPIEHKLRQVQWQRAIAAPRVDDPLKHARAVADELGLYGWVISWETRRDGQGVLHTSIARPGRDYAILVSSDGKTAAVLEKRPGILGVLHYLHGGMSVPGSAWVSSWAWYTRLCSLAALFGAATGIYLFATGRSRRIGWVCLAGAVGVSLAMMAWITLRA